MPQQHFCGKTGEFFYSRLLRNSYFNKRYGNSPVLHSLSYSPKSEKAKRIYLKLCYVFRLFEKPGKLSIGILFPSELIILPDSLTFLSKHFFTILYLI